MIDLSTLPIFFITVMVLFITPGPDMAFLDESGNPRAMRVVMWTGYAGPEWVWP